jgi:hypothetical protein
MDRYRFLKGCTIPFGDPAWNSWFWLVTLIEHVVVPKILEHLAASYAHAFKHLLRELIEVAIDLTLPWLVNDWWFLLLIQIDVALNYSSV